MARVIKRPVYGMLPSCARPRKSVNAPSDREDTHSESSLTSNNSTIECSPRRRNDFLRYDDSAGEEEEDDPVSTIFSHISHSFVDLVQQRTLGLERYSPAAVVDPEYGTRRLLTGAVLRERKVDLTAMNKIFCSQWLNERQIVFGSKCNKLSVYDIGRKEVFSIPLMKSSAHTNRQPEHQCGIHSIAINPSRTVLATGALNTNDVGFYRLPTFDPLAVGEGAHVDWMFDVVWLDDCFLVSGSRDTTMALWKLEERLVNRERQHEDQPCNLRPLSVKLCRTAEKVRALAFNKRDMEVAALSLNGYIHTWKAEIFKQIQSQKLRQDSETVCMSYHEGHNVYAVGSRSHTTIIDARTLQQIQNRNIVSLFPSCGIRSVSFRGDILTIGTGTGAVLFYDLRAAKYMQSSSHRGEVVFKTGIGWGQGPGEVVPVDFSRCTPAIYTHCYDESGTRFFAAGGPLAVERQGSYASLWS